MKSIIALGFGALALAAFAQEPSYDQAEGARNVRQVLETAQLSPANVKRQITADCASLKKHKSDGPQANCAAMRCASGVSPGWSACPAEPPAGAAGAH